MQKIGRKAERNVENLYRTIYVSTNDAERNAENVNRIRKSDSKKNGRRKSEEKQK